jgi:hypothetical protein
MYWRQQAMKNQWFRSWGWIFLPVSWQGILVTLLAILFSAQVFLAIESHSHSVSDTFYGIFPYIVPSWMLVYWIASKTSRQAS